MSEKAIINKLTEHELTTHINKYDKNGDGKISEVELRNLVEDVYKASHHKTDMNDNDNQKVSKFAKDIMLAKDLNKSGFLEKNEFIAYYYDNHAHLLLDNEGKDKLLILNL